MKDKNGIAPIVLGLLLLVGLAVLFGTNFSDGLLGIAFDDFIVEDDFSIPSPALLQQSTVCSGTGVDKFCADPNWQSFSQGNTNPLQCDRRESSVTIENDELVITSRPERSAYAIYQKDLDNRDIKYTATRTAGSSKGAGSGGHRILFNDVLVYSEQFSWGSDGGSDTSSFLFTAFLDIVNPNLYHIEVNGDFINSIEIDEPQIQVKFESFANGNTCTLIPTSTLRVVELKSRPYFNCEVEEDEIVIRDSFVAGTTFNIDSLAFKPVKFCVDSYPAIKRSFTEEGVRADIQGILTRQLTTGESITVAENEVIEIYYIADFTEEMGTRCALDSAWDTKERKCVKIITEQQDIVEIIREKEFIVVGKNQKLFENSLTIGDKEITSSTPQYLCSSEESRASSPNPREECWETEVTYNDIATKYIYGQEKNLDRFFSLRIFQEARYEDNKVQDGAKNQFVLTLKNRDLLSIDNVDEDNEQFYIIFGERRSYPFTVTNRYGDFQLSGVQVTKTKDLLFEQSTEQIDIAFTEGTKEYSIPLDSGEFGGVEYRLIPYFFIGEEIFFDDEQITRNFEVVNEIPTGTQLVEGRQRLSILELLKQLFQRVLDIFR